MTDIYGSKIKLMCYMENSELGEGKGATEKY